MYIHRFGAGSEPKGLWLHGWMGSGFEGNALSARLGGSLICPDLPGHGQTPLGEWTLSDVVKEIAVLAHGVSWVGGYSLGARILMMSAMAYPDVVGPMVLESGFWGYSTSEERQERKQTDRNRAEALLTNGLTRFTQCWYQHPMWGGYTPASRTGTESELAGALERFSSGLQPNLQPWLRTASSRVLWLAGKKDTAYATRADWVQTHTSHQVVLLDTGHNLHGEHPEAWAEAVNQFLLSSHQTEQE